MTDGAAPCVLSLTGERDGFFPPSTILARRGELPRSATVEVIPELNHAQFGNHGSQSGDSPPTLEDAAAREAVVSAMASFFRDAEQARPE